MTTHSSDGREWAKLSELVPGRKLIADGGFTCIKDGAVLEVMRDQSGELYVPCSEGHHNLEGQFSEIDHNHLVGFWLEPIRGTSDV